MAVPSVFISSVIRGFERVRERAALGVERTGMHPVRSEPLTADPDSPRRALLDEVAAADIYLLLLGERYGDVAPSPTEEEYEEATRLNKPILVLVQDEVELEPTQRAFLDRVRGTWGEGVLYGGFAGPDDVGAAVAAALGRYQAGIVEDAPTAQATAAALARGEERRGTTSGGTAARLAFAPLRQTTILDAVALDQAGLGDDLAAAMREAGLAPQSIGITPSVSGDGVQLNGTDAVEWTVPQAEIRRDGSLVVTGSVAVTGTTGFSLVDPVLLEEFFRRAGRFTQLAWDRIDTRDEISQVAVAAAIPEANHKGFGAPSGKTMTMGMMSLPDTIVAPDPPEVVRRPQLADGGPCATNQRRDQAHLRRRRRPAELGLANASSLSAPHDRRDGPTERRQAATLHVVSCRCRDSLSAAGSVSACSPKRNSKIPCRASITFSRASARVRPWLLAPGASAIEAVIQPPPDSS